MQPPGAISSPSHKGRCSVQGLSLHGRTGVSARPTRFLIVLVAGYFAAPYPVVGQERGREVGPDSLAPLAVEAEPLADRPTVRPTRTETPPVIDGHLDDIAWETAARLTEFVQQSPLDGAPATEDTEVYLAYDSDHIYFAFYVHYENPLIMRANRVDRDRAPQDDLVTVYFDTFMDRQRGYDFDVNGYGVQGDGIISATADGPIPRADRSWDALFDTAGRIVEDGYVAEMAIPFKSLRYPSRAEDQEHRWGFQIVREIKSNQENDVWASMSRGESSFFAQMGVLEGMTNISTSRNVEILPTFTAIQYGEIDAIERAFVNQSTDPDAGVNVKYGITSNLTTDFTINPDFSQIESDEGQIEVNQRFPIFFSELRPFFVEGAEIFEVNAPVTLVHTRTIVDPDWGTKLTGKIGAASIGFVVANDRAPARANELESAGFGDGAHTVIGRARYDLYSESNIGAIFTDREFLHSHSRLAGLDGNFRLSPTVSADFRAFGTWRRDLDGVASDGRLLSTRLEQSGRNVEGSVYAYEISPEFQTDVGFVRRADQRRLGGDVSYRFWPENWIINWGPELSYARNWDFEDVLHDEEIGVGLNFSFARNISLGANVNRDMERFGGIDFERTRFQINGNVNTSRTLSFGANYSAGDEIRYVEVPFLGDGSSWGVNATFRPTPRLASQWNVSSSRLTDPRNDDVEVFDVKIFRARNTLQVTDRLSARNIAEYNTFDGALSLNLLFNYRVNAGTVFYIGYDDHYQQGNLIELVEAGEGDEQLYLTDDLRRTNRALFVKFQYLLRY
ncbi:MAG: hypothetical protein GEU90_02435 [Gemmatimonas sp.]|nr:hypothetical protein [Gemmatimonas sp.]